MNYWNNYIVCAQFFFFFETQFVYKSSSERNAKLHV